MEDSSGQFRRHYLVAMSQVVVATDLSEALKETGPCQVSIARTLDELDQATFDMVFVSPSVLNRDDAEKLRALVSSGGKVVVVNGQHDALAEREGWSVLQKPFRQEDVVTLLAGLGVVAG